MAVPTPSSSQSVEAPPQEWTAMRRGEIVLRLLRGEALDALSKETGVTAEALATWRRDFLAGAIAALGRASDDAL